jgi:hypothetical protein
LALPKTIAPAMPRSMNRLKRACWWLPPVSSRPSP